MTEKGPIIPDNSPICVHCVSCLLHCPTGAIGSNSNWRMYNKLLKSAAEGHGFIQSNEKLKSVIYG